MAHKEFEYYNIKRTDYLLGTVVTFYEQPIKVSWFPYDKVESDFLDKIRKEKNEVVSDNEQDIQRSIQQSVARTKKTIYDYAKMVEWEWFVTLTMSPDKTDRSNYSECSYKLRKWLDNVKQTKSDNFKYLVIPELHKDKKSYHFHGLFADCGSMRFALSDNDFAKEKEIYNIKDYRLGFSTATKIKDLKRVTSYITKYVTKEIIETVPVGRQRYYVSKSIPKPAIQWLTLTDQEIEIYKQHCKEKAIYIDRKKIENKDYQNKIEFYHLS